MTTKQLNTIKGSNGNTAPSQMVTPGGLTAQQFNPDLFTAWANYIDATPRTVDTYAKAVKQFALYLERNGIERPTRDDVINFRNELNETHKPATTQLYLTALKQFFKWTETNNYYPNITTNVKGPKSERGFKKDYLTAEQAKALLNSVNVSTVSGLRDYAILATMITTGVRTVEVTRANVGDLRNVAGFTALFIQGKGHADRAEYVKTEPAVLKAISSYLSARRQTETLTPDAPLFSSISHNNLGGRLTTRTVSRIVKESLKSIGLDSDYLTAHSLRHTTATLNLLNGGTIEETRQLLRHSNINTTLIYSHALTRASNQSEARVASAIFGS